MVLVEWHEVVCLMCGCKFYSFLELEQYCKSCREKRLLDKYQVDEFHVQIGGGDDYLNACGFKGMNFCVLMSIELGACLRCNWLDVCGMLNDDVFCEWFERRG